MLMAGPSPAQTELQLSGAAFERAAGGAALSEFALTISQR